MISSDFIPNQWYPICDSSKLKRGKPAGLMRLGEPLVLWRESRGKVVCITDRCPHRAAQLSLGWIQGDCLVCPFHGLRFDSAGNCVLIPANGEGRPVPHGFDLPRHPVRESHGLIWYWYGDSEPAAEIPWFPEAPDPGPRTSFVERDYPVSYLRVMENLGDMHHVPFVHRATIPGAGTRVQLEEAWLDGAIIRMKVSLHHERPGWMRPVYNFTYAMRLSTLATITVMKGVQFVASATPIDADHTWLWARYGQEYVPGWLGGKIIARLAAMFDLRLVFTNQDMRMLASQQRNDPDDISSYHLVEADRAIALYFGLRKQAIDAAGAVDHSMTTSPSSDTPVLGSRNRKGITAASITAISQKQSL
jgi:phenylpropionate dioxygenase-like ring-hydroxylating dioxygenase large terminal subunit